MEIRIALQTLLAEVGDQRVKSLAKKYPELAEGIQTLADADPTSGKQTYLQWATNKLKAGADLVEIGEAVQAFHETKKLLIEKDLGKYKTPKDVLNKSEEAIQAEEDAKKPELVYNKDGARIYRIYTKAQMCEIGEGSDWCTAEPEGTLWEKEYTNKPGWAFYVIEEKGGKYLGYVVDRITKELRDWKNTATAEAVEKVELLYAAGLVESFNIETDEDEEYAEEERQERYREEAYDSAKTALEGIASKIVELESEDIFEEFVESVDGVWEYPSRWDKVWVKYLSWATNRILKYFKSKAGAAMRGQPFTDPWGLVPWGLEVEAPINDRDDSALGYFSFLEEGGVYARLLVKEFFETEVEVFDD